MTSTFPSPLPPPAVSQFSNSHNLQIFADQHSYFMETLSSNVRMRVEVLKEIQIVERDEEALKYLNDIKWCRIDVPKGFKLEFFFDPNPYFKNSALTKTYHIIDDDELVMEEANGMEVEWYPGKCLTLKLLKKKPRKGSKNAKPVIKTEKCASFFNFFKPPAAELEDQMDQDYTVGTTIRNKIIPHAVSWFTGEAEGDDCDEIDSEDYDEEEEEEDEEDEDEDDDSEVKDRKKVRTFIVKTSSIIHWCSDTNNARIISVNGRGVGSSISNKAGGGQPSEHAPDCRRQDRIRVM
ncbi:hypothetical protein QYF36_009731 [Acer negundo]|nr:hypothetical protein QYF36_009731 [Acer negundo]